jgi:hypothetical protein
LLNWRAAYAIEQHTRLHEISSLASKMRTKQLESEIALLKASNARLARDERELFCCANPVPSTDNSSPS